MHLVEDPAVAGFDSLRKCRREPKDETRLGVAGCSQWHIMSMSLSTHSLSMESKEDDWTLRSYWHDFVINEKQLSASLRQ